MRSSHLSPALLVILLLGAATQASTQSVILGSVREAGNEVAISTAEIRLADAEGRIITSDLTDDQGRFRLEVESRGDYSLSVRRIGYARIDAALLAISDDEQVEIDIQLHPSVVILDAVRVVASTPTMPHRILEFRERAALNQRLGRGRIYLREELDRLRPNSPHDLLDAQAWVARCRPTILLDGLPVEGRLPPMHHEEVEGVEFYRGVNQIPPEYYRYGMCGLAMVWTRPDPPNARPLTWRRVVVGGVIMLLIGALSF